MMDKTVISTRIRLARNLKNMPFPCRMSLEQKHEVCQKVKRKNQKAPARCRSFLWS